MLIKRDQINTLFNLINNNENYTDCEEIDLTVEDASADHKVYLVHRVGKNVKVRIKPNGEAEINSWTPLDNV